MRSSIFGNTHKGLMALGFAVSLLALPAVSHAQGIVRGAQEGAQAGDRAAGPVGGAVGTVVGGVGGGVVGGVKGVLGVPQRTAVRPYRHSRRYRHHRRVRHD